MLLAERISRTRNEISEVSRVTEGDVDVAAAVVEEEEEEEALATLLVVEEEEAATAM